MTAGAALHDGLRSARARLHRNRMAIAWRQGVTRAAVALAIVAAAAAGVGLFSRGSASPAATRIIWGIGGAAVLTVLLDRPFRAWRRPPTDADTAERVDLAAGTRNRIATALDLVAAETHSPYAAAAIASGVNALNTHATTPPVRPTSRFQIRTTFIALTIAALCVLAATSPWSTPEPLSLSLTPSGTPTTATTAAAVATQPAKVAAPPPAPRSTAAPTAGGRGVAPAGALPNQATAGQSTAGTGAPVDTALAAADAPLAQPPATPAPAPTAVANTASARAQPSGSSGSGPGSASAAGRGGTRQQSPAVPGAWLSHEQIADALDADTDAAAVPPDPAAADAHNGALQPLLQDRAPAASRELGIGSPKDGPSGNGRGGPSVQKKSRGVAALLMAVPIPQHLRARLLAGTSRTSEAFAPPAAGPQTPAPATPTAPRQGDEPPLRSEATPPDQADLLTRYFAALHSDAQPDDSRP